MKNLFRSANRKRLIIIVLIHFSVLTFAQERYENTIKSIQNLIKISEDYYGVDDELVNGCVYSLPDYRIKGNPYLMEDNWSEGVVYSKGKAHKDLTLKYDLLNEAIILRIIYSENNNRLIELNKFHVDSFLLEKRLFVNSRVYFSNHDKQIFYEQINNDSYSLLIKHKKVFLRTYNELTPYGRFSALRNDKYLLHNKILINANSLRSFLDGFYEIDKKKVKDYMKQNGINYSNASSQELKALMNFCNLITATQNEN